MKMLNAGEVITMSQLGIGESSGQYEEETSPVSVTFD